MEVLCRLSYSGVTVRSRAMIPRLRPGPGPWDHGSMRSALILVLLLAAACGSSPEPGHGAGGSATLEIRTASGIRSFQVEVADTTVERRTGLMGRETLSPFDGMAFLWTDPVQGSFWMKDTLIPLSIAFWDQEGRIVSIMDMEPCRADPCPTYGPGAPYVGALEVAKGELERRGVGVGDTVDLTIPGA
jgi:uncharacterized membrane protein (UPF0127 family)